MMCKDGAGGEGWEFILRVLVTAWTASAAPAPGVGDECSRMGERHVPMDLGSLHPKVGLLELARMGEEFGSVCRNAFSAPLRLPKQNEALGSSLCWEADPAAIPARSAVMRKARALQLSSSLPTSPTGDPPHQTPISSVFLPRMSPNRCQTSLQGHRVLEQDGGRRRFQIPSCSGGGGWKGPRSPPMKFYLRRRSRWNSALIDPIKPGKCLHWGFEEVSCLLLINHRQESRSLPLP